MTFRQPEPSVPHKLPGDRSPKTRLLVDFEFSGHHAIYLCYIVRYGLADAPFPVRLLITRKLYERTLKDLSAPEQALFSRSVELLEDDPVWVWLRKRFKRHVVACWLYYETLNLRRRKDRLVLLYMETISYGMALCPLPRFDSSALMFRPTFYYRTRGMLDPGLRSVAVFGLKWVTSLICRLRPGIRRIFTLDPLAEEYARSSWGTEKFQCIADPLGLDPGKERPIGVSNAGPKDTLRLLVAGALSPRKGVKETVDALEACAEPIRRKIILDVIGEPDKDSEEYVRTNLDRAIAAGITVLENLRFVGIDELDNAMKIADLILVPYRGFKGSSGTVIRAAHFGKPVLSTDDGLMAYFVRTHHLGVAIDVADRLAFASVLTKFLETGNMPGFSPEGARAYADASEPRYFVEPILS